MGRRPPRSNRTDTFFPVMSLFRALWLNWGFIHLQPSELMKLAIVLAVARFYTILPAGEIRKWTAIWPMLVLIGVPAFLILIQPDLGTATTVVVGGVTVAFLAGLPLRLFIGSGLAVPAALPVAFSFLPEYQQKRVLIFLDPESDRKSTRLTSSH